MRVAVEKSELSCVIGNLFEGLEPPCDSLKSEELTIGGMTFSGKSCTVTVHDGYIDFEGSEEDIRAVMDSRCLERRCEYGK